MQLQEIRKQVNRQEWIFRFAGTTCPCCQHLMEDIGTNVREHLRLIPAKAILERHVQAIISMGVGRAPEFVENKKLDKVTELAPDNYRRQEQGE